ncbi:hypothetical protein Ocin01_03678 [Orchesella cincta]|uniref:Ig-like domain-containing protein n=1 Tax=Orchesella cincta TaxID=48709 RepID=A0A1D2NCL5_ORCCI|nr:hypothetical protein Ocin01_03678 [Orchesella cincta]
MTMLQSHIAPTVFALLLWITTGLCQYDPYGGSPFYGEPEPFGQFAGLPPQPAPQQFYPPNNANINPFLPAAGQAQSTQQQQQGYPNLPSVPFQTVSPNNNANPNQRVDRYPFPPQTLGNLGGSGINNNQIQQQQTFGNSFLNPNSQQYPKIPDFPFQTVTPGGNSQQNPNILAYPRTQLPKVRVIEYPSADYFEYGGGKLVTPKRPNSDLYVGGVGGDVPITSKIFIECTGPNQVEWVFNGTEKRDLSVVTKNFQITIPEQRDPTPLSGEYTYLRLGLEKQIEEKDTGIYMCRDRILPQNYITIRVIVASRLNGGYPVLPFSGSQQSLPPFVSNNYYGVGHPSSNTFKFGTPAGGNFDGGAQFLNQYDLSPMGSPRVPPFFYNNDNGLDNRNQFAPPVLYPTNRPSFSHEHSQYPSRESLSDVFSSAPSAIAASCFTVIPLLNSFVCTSLFHIL